MKIIDEGETQTNKQTKKQTKTKKNKGRKAIVKGWELNDFVVRLSYVFSY